jgi:hypothetical protein
MHEEVHSLLIRGIAAAKAGQTGEARRYLEWLFMRNPQADQKIEAWYWLCEISTDETEQRRYLEDMLAYSPGDARARRKLAVLNGGLNEEEIIDPNKNQQASLDSVKIADARRFTCPNCGGRMSFRPDGQSLTCENCDAQDPPTPKRLKEQEIKEDDFVVSLATARGHGKSVSIHSLTCQGCGAVFILPPESLTSFCPYCDTPYALEKMIDREVIEPAALIPFMLSGDRAKQALSEWLEERSKPKFHEDIPLQGVYLPAWTFDMAGDVPWACQVLRSRNWENKSGYQPVHFDDLMMLATDRLPVKLRSVVQSFDSQYLVPYDTRYIAAWTAETYRISMSNVSLEARGLALEEIRRQVQSSFLRPLRNLVLDSSKLYIESSKLILLPVWLGRYSMEGKRYHVALNGQTGDVFGESPRRNLRGLIRELLD